MSINQSRNQLMKLLVREMHLFSQDCRKSVWDRISLMSIRLYISRLLLDYFLRELWLPQRWSRNRNWFCVWIIFHITNLWHPNRVSTISSELLLLLCSMVQVTNWFGFRSAEQLCSNWQKVGSRKTMFNRMERFVKLFLLVSLLSLSAQRILKNNLPSCRHL